MRPLESQTILITGATDGMGRALAKTLAVRGAHVIVHGRDPARVDATVHEIREAHPDARLSTALADFASLHEVARMAGAISAEHPRLDVLVSNAGIGGGAAGQGRQRSRDGHELRLAVNYLAPYLLTRRLIPLLRRSAPARIVNVSSVGQQALDFDDVMLTRGYSGFRAYCQSKLAQILSTFDLAEELAGSGVTVNALHPASLMDTKMVFESFGYATSKVADGVAATLRLVIDPALQGVTGRYFDQQREARPEAQAFDREARAQLRTLSEALIAAALASA